MPGKYPLDKGSEILRACLCAAIGILVSGLVTAQQPAPADGTRARDALPVQPAITAESGQAKEIRQLRAAVCHLQEQVNQLSGKPEQRDSRELPSLPANAVTDVSPGPS